MFELLMGHLAGDYLLQNEFLALNKSKNTKTGWIAAIIHCLLYTFAVCVFMWNFNWYWILIVFMSHFLIDKFNFTEWYLTKIKGRSLRKFINKNGFWHDGLPKPQGIVNRYDILEGGFNALVYTIADNTLHLILMWGAYKLIY